jgi:hypothetical protein
MFMHFSGFENWGVGVAKLTLNLQFDCFVTHLHMFSRLFSFESEFPVVGNCTCLQNLH